MKRILIAVHKFFPNHRAGTEVLTLKVSQELIRRGYEVLVLTANPPDTDARHASGPDTADYIYEGVPVHVVEEPLRLAGYTFMHEFEHKGIAGHFKEVINRFRPDLVHVFHAQNLSASIVHVASQMNIPIIFSAMDFWFVCPLVQLRRTDGKICRGPSMMAANCLTCYTPELFPPVGQVAAAVGKKYGALAKAITCMPGPLRSLSTRFLYGAYVAGKLPAAARATIARPAYLQTAANKFASIMVPTAIMREIFVENGIDERLIEHVPFGIDTAPLDAYKSKTVSDVLRIGYIGTFYEHKGVDLLIQACANLPEHARASLTLYGDLNQFPEYGKMLSQLAARLQKKNCPIYFADTFPNVQLGPVMTGVDVLVVPSRWYENTPLVIQSALATKTPVVATNLGGMSELVKHEYNGLLFDLNDSDSLARQLVRLIENPQLYSRLRENIGPERTIAQMVGDIEAVYERVGNTGRNSQSAIAKRTSSESTVLQ